MNPALAALLSHPAIWRGEDCAREPASVPSGFRQLDAALPGGGWPRGALTELLLEREGIGELRLTLPALARLQAEGRSIVWVVPPYRPHAPALTAAGLDPSSCGAALLRKRCGRMSRHCAHPNAERHSAGWTHAKSG
jgi:hypothetical protein